ncbi:MAG: ImmA/IrrE family metallo-endopeptidase [Myxococcota bacterium]
MWLGESGVSDAQALKVSSHGVERWCNEVAAEFLVPLASVKAELRKTGDVREEMKRLAAVYKVSTLVILRRMHDAGALDAARFRQERAPALWTLRCPSSSPVPGLRPPAGRWWTSGRVPPSTQAMHAVLTKELEVGHAPRGQRRSPCDGERGRVAGHQPVGWNQSGDRVHGEVPDSA